LISCYLNYSFVTPTGENGRKLEMDMYTSLTWWKTNTVRKVLLQIIIMFMST